MFKKILVASAITVATMSTAMADWQIVSQEDNAVVAQESNLGIVLSVAKLGKTGSVDVAELANQSAQGLGCGSVQQVEIAGVSGYGFEGCPNNVFAFIADDGEEVGMISGACDTDEKCAAIAEFIGQSMAK